MTLFDGKEQAKLLDTEILGFVSKNVIDKTLVIFQIGDNLSSEKYISLKQSLCVNFGLSMEVHKISADFSDKDISDQIAQTFLDPRVAGGVIQLPLPRPTLNKVLDLIPVEKDIDVLSSASQERMRLGNFSRLSPVVRALKLFMETANLSPKGLSVGILGFGNLVGKPAYTYLQHFDAQLRIIENYEKGQKLSYDLVIISIGSPGLVDPRDIAAGTSVIDFGSTVKNGKTYGDLDSLLGIEHLNYVSLSPGGMGPVVVRYLIMNFLGI